MPRVNRGKKYEWLLRYLTETMNNPHVKRHLRDRAAHRLATIFERLDKNSESERLRREKRAKKKAGELEELVLDAATPLIDQEEEAAQEEEARMQDVFANILNKEVPNTGESENAASSS